MLETMRQIAVEAHQNLQLPYELEAKLGYPGSPSSVNTKGGDTVRRILGAYQRYPEWQNWACSPAMKQVMQQLFDNLHISITQVHHNCLMTKSPTYSSDTGWHQDTRYWSFKRPLLINSWLALGKEQPDNGGMWVIPGSHLKNYDDDQFDEDIFFRDDLSTNQQLIKNAVPVLLEAGDVLFFDARVLHRASRNLTSETKYALVFSYHETDNLAVSGSRSSSMPEIDLVMDRIF